MKTTFVAPEVYQGRSVTVRPWDVPPPMETGAPEPALYPAGNALYLAYICRNPEFPGWDNGAVADHPGFEVFSALVRFDGVTEHYSGPPNDEALHLHPLYSRGLGFYGFWEVVGSPKAVSGQRHWICTFHDQTVEVVAESAELLDARVLGENTLAIARSRAHA